MPSGRDQWIAVAKAIYSRLGEVQVTDRAAAMTYYSILSLFPALLVVVSLLALLGEYPDTYQSISSTLRGAAPGTAVDTIDSALRTRSQPRGRRRPPGRRAGARALLRLGGDRRRSAGAGGDQPGEARAEFPSEPRRAARIDGATGAARPDRVPRSGGRWPVVRQHRGVRRLLRPHRRPGRLPALAHRGSGPAHRLRRPLCARAAAHPAPGDRSLVSVLPGAAIGTALWFAVSLLFTAYVSHFGSYDKTYGTLGALISLLIWLWLGNLAFLLGALFNAEKEQVRGDGR